MLHDQLREQSTLEQPREYLKPTGLASILDDIIITEYVKGTKTILDQAKEEMDAYLNFGTLSLGRDPLEWWKEYSSRFPLLARLAKNVYVYQLPVCHQSVFLYSW